ncbi:MAG: sugar transferase, partial [Acidimicrobiales bacterium]
MRRSAHLLTHVGIVVVVLGLSKVHAAWVAAEAYDYTSSFRFAWSLAFVLMLSAATYGAGLPDLPRGTRSATATAAGASMLATAAMSLVQLLDADIFLPRFVVLGSGLVLVPWFTLCSAVAAGGRRRAGRRDRVVVVGDWADAAEITDELAAGAERQARVTGVLTPVQARSTGSDRPLEEAGADATVVVLDRVAQMDEGIVDQVARLHESGVRVRTLSLFYEQWLGKLPVAELERVSLMFDIGALHRGRYNRLKRVLDLALALSALPVLAIAVPIVAVANLAANRGPLFYRQDRVGLAGATFRIVKFRTMTPAPDGALVDEWTEEADPRITPFGRLLRVSHLDELPQL